MSCNSAQVRLVGADLPLESNAGALLFGDCPWTEMTLLDHSEHAGCTLWFMLEDGQCSGRKLRGSRSGILH